MTNYNEKLDEVLDFIENYGVSASTEGFDKTASRAKAKQAILSLKKQWEIDILKRVASVHCGIPTKTLKRADLKDWLVYEINQLNGDKR